MVKPLNLKFRMFTIKLVGVQRYEPRCEKTSLRGFQPGPTQTRLYNHRRWLDA